MEKNYLTETEIMTLRHILGFGNEKIRRFENMNLSDAEKQFIIFEMMMGVQKRERNKVQKVVEKKNWFSRIFK